MTTTTAAPPRTPLVSPSQLFLDPTNPRLAGHHFTLQDQEGILDWLWKNKSVDELVESLLASGFWPHEELFATAEEGRLVVVEGNRRLAAVKLLLDPALRKSLRIREFSEPTEAVRATLQSLPVITKTREAIWQFIGFKHVNGPQEWDSIAKAEYVHRVRQTYNVALTDIARSIGDKHETVQRLYRGYLVFRQAQGMLDFEPEDSTQKKFPFSHLWTALGYTSVRNFLGVDSESLERENPVSDENLENLRSLMLWLFGSRSKGIEAKVSRQNPDLRRLAQALENAKGVQILLADLPLSAAREATLGDDHLFREALLGSEQSLRDAKRFVATGYHGEEELLETATAVEALAKSLRREMAEQESDDSN